jgi:hypothetical protein
VDNDLQRLLGEEYAKSEIASAHDHAGEEVSDMG